MAGTVTETNRIRWDDGPEPAVVWSGYVGTLLTPAFKIYGPDERAHNWLLAVQFGPEGSLFFYADDPDESKAQAERWLEEFISSLGAVFPDALAADLRSRADELDGTVAHDTSHERDKQLFSAGLRRAADLIEHGDQPMASVMAAREE